MSGICDAPLFSFCSRLFIKTKSVFYYMNDQPTELTYAATANVMAEIMPDFDWDAWKDEMKESE